MPQKKHVLITCYDGRLDDMVAKMINDIRSQGGHLAGKDIVRIPGGPHLLVGKSDCRKAFYELLSGYKAIAGSTVFHLLPHTNCQWCGIHLPEKLGNGTQSDLRFHLQSAKKMLAGANDHFSSLPLEERPEFDSRIILTIDQRIVTIDEAHRLLPHIPEHHGHGKPCCTHHSESFIGIQA